MLGMQSGVVAAALGEGGAEVGLKNGLGVSGVVVEVWIVEGGRGGYMPCMA